MYNFFKIQKTDVLGLEWTTAPSRDRLAATLVCNYLRYQGYSVKEYSIFAYRTALKKYKPNLLFMTNSTGASINFDAVKFAKQNTVAAISLFSEGNFTGTPETLTEFQWGWNTDRQLYEEKSLYWSKRARNLILPLFPEVEKKTAVCGAVGFDNYKIMPHTDKFTFLKKYNKQNFKKIIGFGLWDFGMFDQRDSRFETAKKVYGKQYFDFYLADRNKFNEEIIALVSSMPNILFLLKEHPGVALGRWASGIEGLEQFSNVLILKNEESILDCIDVSDIWMVYESTTAVEAWLRNKPTGLLNPSGTDFPRAELYKGSVAFNTAIDLKKAIEEFYRTAEFPGFFALAEKRKKLVVDTMQWDDGLNHVRAGNEIIQLLKKNSEQTIKIRGSVVKYMREKIRWFIGLFPFVPQKYTSLRKMWNEAELTEFSNVKMQEQINYYNLLKLSKQDLLKISTEK